MTGSSRPSSRPRRRASIPAPDVSGAEPALAPPSGLPAASALAPDDAAGLDAAVHANRRRARSIAALPGVVVFAVVAIVLSAVGDPVAGLVAGAAAGVASSVALLFGGTSLLLRALRARFVEEERLPRAYNIVDGLCASMGLTTPPIWLVEDEVRDALSLGRGPRTAVLVVTAGLVEALDPVALEGVLAHELTHVKCGDIAPGTVSAALLLPFAAFVPAVSGAVHRLAGRGREFRADQLAVGVTRYPPGLREALSQIAGGPRPRSSSPLAGRGAPQATRWLWTVALPISLAGAGGGAFPGRDAHGGGGFGDREEADEIVGELDAASVRIAALDEC